MPQWFLQCTDCNMPQWFLQCTDCNMPQWFLQCTDCNMPQWFRQCTDCNMPQWFRQCTDCNMPQWFRQCTYCNMHSVQTVICHNDYDCVQIVVCHIMCFTFGSVPDVRKNDQFCQCYVRVKQKCWRHQSEVISLTPLDGKALAYFSIQFLDSVKYQQGSFSCTHTELENVKHPQNDRPHCQWFHE